MYKVAIKMLLGDRAKYIGLIFGVTFATLLISQQVSIFMSFMARTASTIYNVTEADIWVMDKRVLYIEEVEPLRDIELINVRSVPGVAWAAPFYKGLAVIRMPDGLTQQVQLIGVDQFSMVGICSKAILGDLASIRHPQNAIMDGNGYLFTWPGQPIKLGREIEMNDHRLVINAICDASPNFLTFPIMYVSYTTAMEITPPQRNKMSFILVKAKPGIDSQNLAAAIQRQTRLQALTSNDFAWRSINYVLQRTGIAINFGITVFLGILIGGAITAQTFYIFVIENLKHFASMKAIGVTNRQLLTMILTQAGIIYAIGYSFGVGLTACFFKATKNLPALKGFSFYWQVMAGSASVIAIIICLSIVVSLRKVFNLDPAVVFRV